MLRVAVIGEDNVSVEGYGNVEIISVPGEQIDDCIKCYHPDVVVSNSPSLLSELSELYSMFAGEY